MGVQDGATALDLAALRGHLEAVQLLLEAKADVDAPGLVSVRGAVRCVRSEVCGQDDESALTAACANGHVEVARALLGRGASVAHRDKVRPHARGGATHTTCVRSCGLL